MSTVTTYQEARSRLVKALTDNGDLRSPAWQAAFEAVPRETFTPNFDIRDGEIRRAYAPGDSGYLEAVYTDTSLVTRWDGAGVATSSSTMPSLMARMLEALTLPDDANILEIGTGTGYNTALLCCRLGADNVTSVDVEPTLTAVARERLAQLGYQPTVVTGDGMAGCSERAPYHAILATCGVRRIPIPWLRQLRPGGVVVTNIGAGIVRLVRHEDGGAEGRFLPETAAFMLARSGPEQDAENGVHHLGLALGEEGEALTDTIPTTSEDADRFFADLVLSDSLDLTLRQPEVLAVTLTRDDGRTHHCLMDPATRSWARVTPVGGVTVCVEHGGSRDLWRERADILSHWIRAGRPGPAGYGLRVAADGHHTLWRDGAEGREAWRLPG
ncbi:methyltransferase domain-containing protein [Streptomyces millisiae]|uniref:Protein-L-isoaspartate O-methyltransferase n=1 Tax=Streptomyces millisiae TaxID=3075542 RepID=A0ABU2LTR0_9ACTN|nr:methyltransferase domain-containing protein [Streptomyces sp. DSM 44918]MDT0320547.1 methyltransferase domain-containing protein [Streptomyces sp. DSM 44918]